MKILFLLLLILLPTLAFGDNGSTASINRKIERLRAYIQKEKPEYEKRKQVALDTLERLDQINAEQNQLRQQIESNQMNSKELNMALDNLSVEFKKEQREELIQKQKLVNLLKIAHKVKRDGVLRFVLDGADLADLVGRVRVLFRTLRSHSAIAHHVEQKRKRLTESEDRIRSAKHEMEVIGKQLESQHAQLTEVLQQKKVLLRQLNRQQNLYLAKYKDYKIREKKLARLFKKFDAKKTRLTSNDSKQRWIRLPLDKGSIIKKFGKTVHRKFKTVTYQKGLEISSDHSSQVYAVLDGTVEFDGWVKGLGNVVIVHHGEGLYSLSGHLYMSLLGVGAKVKQGEAIGLVGDTGNSDKASLYFELRKNEDAVDPMEYFTKEALTGLS